MYFDPDGGVQYGASSQPPAFHIDYLTGDDAKESGACPQCLPLGQLYFCDGCSRVVSRQDLTEDVDSYYCPHCLENMPSSEAMLYGMRCSKCWECPICSSTLTMCTSTVGTEPIYHLSCGFCRWSSRGRLEAPQPEHLVKKIIELERQCEPRTRICVLIDAFRSRAQEQQKERDHMQRMRRRSSISRGSVLGSIGGKRHMTLRRSHSMRDGRPAGPWTIEMLESKLQDKSAKRLDLRPEVKEAEEERNEAESAKTEEENIFEMLDKEDKAKDKAKAKETVQVPVLQGLTVDELLKAHVQPAPALRSRRSTVVGEMQASLDDDHGISNFSTLQQRRQQITSGYQLTRCVEEIAPVSVSEAPGEHHIGEAQLEAPIHNTDMWGLLPVRKPLLTKRSRRCRLAAVGPRPSMNSRQESRTNSGVTRKAEDSHKGGDSRQCGKIVVKPQINPCSNPPFQKNNAATTIIPRCLAWGWLRDGAAATAEGGGKLNPSETAELVFSLNNPLDSDVQVSLDPTAFNPSKAAGTDSEVTGMLAHFLVEQNVEVLTAPFETTIGKFNDLAEVHELGKDDEARMKLLKEQDDPDVVPGRKLAKVLVRLRFQGLQADAIEPKSRQNTDSWVFYVELRLSIKHSSLGEHDSKVILRFAFDKRRGAENGQEPPASV